MLQLGHLVIEVVALADARAFPLIPGHRGLAWLEVWPSDPVAQAVQWPPREVLGDVALDQRMNASAGTITVNLVLICLHHHWKVHEAGWYPLRTDEGIQILPRLPRVCGDWATARAPTGAPAGRAHIGNPTASMTARAPGVHPPPVR
ncbi:MAG TPA: hypothetical protein VEK76_12645 [Candidatus Binatia bacterium]|nr:hypothetical protein [Candidatus Binatia bacterium]